MTDEAELRWCRKEIQRLRKMVQCLCESANGRYVVAEFDAVSDPLRPVIAILVSDDDSEETMAASLAKHLIPMLGGTAKPTGEVKVNR